MKSWQKGLGIGILLAILFSFGLGYYLAANTLCVEQPTCGNIFKSSLGALSFVGPVFSILGIIIGLLVDRARKKSQS